MGSTSIVVQFRVFVLGLCLFLGVSACKKTVELDSASKDAALGAALSWLSLVDHGKYAESHAEAASYFKGALTADKWATTIKGVREPLGPVISRKVKKSTAAAALPGAPDGKYLVIVYETSFEKKAQAQETVTPMLDADGKWRVAGYYIK